MMWVDGGYVVSEQASFDPGGAAPASAAPGGASRSAGDVTVGATKRRRTKWIFPLLATACYVLFTVAVHLRLLDSLDTAVRSASHAGEVWGPDQIRAARIVHWLQPTHVSAPLLLVVAVLSLLRRSFRPFAVMAAVGGLMIIMTLGTKWLMAHTETDARPIAHGSFPSGHTVSVIVAFGLLVLLLRPRTRWGWILPALIGCLMGWAVVVAAFHPTTDVVGAILLAVAALVTARSAGLGTWASHRRTKGVVG
jgi:membrane-associated phospholipid phosphatase